MILSRNVKALQGVTPAYCQPGFESTEFQLANHDMAQSLRKEQYEVIGAAPAIQMPPSPGRGPYSNLVELEHAHLAISLFGQGRQPPSASAWWQHPLNWSGEMQRQTRFRASPCSDEGFVLYQADEDEPLRFHRLEDRGEPELVEVSCFERQTFTPAERVAPWLDNEPEALLAAQGEQLEWDVARLSRTFTEIRLPSNKQSSRPWQYDPQFGVYKALN